MELKKSPCANCKREAVCGQPCLEWESWFKKTWRELCQAIRKNRRG